MVPVRACPRKPVTVPVAVPVKVPVSNDVEEPVTPGEVRWRWEWQKSSRHRRAGGRTPQL